MRKIKATKADFKKMLAGKSDEVIKRWFLTSRKYPKWPKKGAYQRLLKQGLILKIDPNTLPTYDEDLP